MCQATENECVESAKQVNFDSECLPKCQGVLVTSFDKQELPLEYSKRPMPSRSTPLNSPAYWPWGKAFILNSWPVDDICVATAVNRDTVYTINRCLKHKNATNMYRRTCIGLRSWRAYKLFTWNTYQRWLRLLSDKGSLRLLWDDSCHIWKEFASQKEHS